MSTLSKKLYRPRHRLNVIVHSLSARWRHGIHSPWAFGLQQQLSAPFPTDVLPLHRRIAQAWERMGRSTATVQVNDIGAGSKGRGAGTHRLVLGQIARRAGSGPKKGQFLARLVLARQARQVLELGTNLGFSAAWMCSGLPEDGRLTSIEYDAGHHLRAKELLAELGLQHRARLLQGSFAQVLPGLQGERFDLVFVDGDHTYAGILANVEAVLPLLAPQAWVVLDDIRWSADCLRAWKELQHHPRFPRQADWFGLGLLELEGNAAPQRHLLKRNPFF